MIKLGEPILMKENGTWLCNGKHLVLNFFFIMFNCVNVNDNVMTGQKKKIRYCLYTDNSLIIIVLVQLQISSSNSLLLLHLSCVPKS